MFKLYGAMNCLEWPPFGFEGGMLDLIVLAPDHCLSFYFVSQFSFLLIKVQLKDMLMYAIFLNNAQPLENMI